MPRVQVTDDNGTVTWDERVTAADFTAEHFRRCFVDRLSWAVADADGVNRVMPLRPVSAMASNSTGERARQTVGMA
jgi:hypothetical protein